MPGKKKKGGGKKSKGGKKGKKSAALKAGDIYRPPVLSQEDSLYKCLLRTRWWLVEEAASIKAYTTTKETQLKKKQRDEQREKEEREKEGEKEGGDKEGEKQGDEQGEKLKEQKGDDEVSIEQKEISIDEFKSTMRYLEIPATAKQIDLFIKYLDPAHTGSVQIKTLTDLVSKKDHELLNIAYTTSLMDPLPPDEDTTTGGKKGKKKKKASDAEKIEVVKKDWRKGEPCKSCGIAMLEPPPEHQPLYVQLQLTLAMFKDLHKHPGHFVTHLTTGTTICGLIDIVIKHWSKSTSTVAIFSDPSCKKDTYLNPTWTLSECGIIGGTNEYAPTRYQLFYDFIPELIDCPILMADTAIMRNVPPLVGKRKL